MITSTHSLSRIDKEACGPQINSIIKGSPKPLEAITDFN